MIMNRWPMTVTVPFTAPDPVSIMYKHVHEKPVTPRERNPKIPVWLDEIILRCLEKKPSDRYSQALEIKMALAEKSLPENLFHS